VFNNGVETVLPIDPDVYLMEMNNKASCMSLITEVDVASNSNEWMILGTPFFRTALVSFDYYNSTIAIKSKTTNSPIIPLNSDSKTGLSEGAILGISLGSIAFLLILILAICFACCQKKSKKELHYEEIDADDTIKGNTIQGGEDDEAF